MGIEAKVIADSINEWTSTRLTTLQLKFPRFILAEFNTHRVLSRNASSSRAIPTKKILEAVRVDPVEPIFWGKNQPGMQAIEELTGKDLWLAKDDWHTLRLSALSTAERMAAAGAHKQIVNRILEPWMWAHVVVTATEWENFFALRTDKAAQPEMKRLADLMLEAMNASTPVARGAHDWHLPYVSEEERERTNPLCDQGSKPYHLTAICFSVARCARVSYLNHDGTQPDAKKDLELYDRLATSGHASPFEHQARPINPLFETYGVLNNLGNFRNWFQFRKTLLSENRKFAGLRKHLIGG